MQLYHGYLSKRNPEIQQWLQQLLAEVQAEKTRPPKMPVKRRHRFCQRGYCLVWTRTRTWTLLVSFVLIPMVALTKSHIAFDGFGYSFLSSSREHDSALTKEVRELRRITSAPCDRRPWRTPQAQYNLLNS
jgi:hypothetical protein